MVGEKRGACIEIVSVIACHVGEGDPYVLFNRREDGLCELPTIEPFQLGPKAVAYSRLAIRPVWRNLRLFDSRNVVHHLPRLLKTYGLFDSPERNEEGKAAIGFLFEFNRELLPGAVGSSTVKRPIWLRRSLCPHLKMHGYADHFEIVETLLPSR